MNDLANCVLFICALLMFPFAVFSLMAALIGPDAAMLVLLLVTAGYVVLRISR